MTLKELKIILDECGLDDNTQVILSSDSEGNHFSPAIEICWGFAEWTEGDVHWAEEDEKVENPCLIIYPA